MCEKLTKRLIPAVMLLANLAFADATAPDIVSLSVKEIKQQPALLQDTQFISLDQPDIETLRLAANAGITTIIDFRTAGEDRGMQEAAEVAKLGMTYMTMPVGGPDDMTMEKAAEFDQLLAAARGPALLHCSSGNRVGAMMALRASLHGASPDAAIAVGRQAGLTRSEEVVRSRIIESQE